MFRYRTLRPAASTFRASTTMLRMAYVKPRTRAEARTEAQALLESDPLLEREPVLAATVRSWTDEDGAAYLDKV